MAAVVELVGAHKSFGETEAVRGVDLAIEPGRLVAILGPNGAGKTTVISLMLGLRKPTAGRALLFGIDPADRRARSRVGVMLQESGVPNTLKVKELMGLFASYYPHSLPLSRTLALSDLADKADSSVGQLSGGQKQRLYFALAICGDPEVIFLDEPTVGMDVQYRRLFLDSIRQFATAGKTIILTTHYLDEADELAERIVVIGHGKVIADGTPREIKSRVAGKKMSFTSDGMSASNFDGLPVSNLDIRDGRVKVLSNAPEDVLRELFRRGLTIADLEVTGADLEEAFISITREAG